MKMIQLLFITTLISCLCHVQGQSQCTTSTGKVGQCISIRDCSSLLSLAFKTNKTNDDLQTLRQSYCGHPGPTPMVCCPLTQSESNICFTPEAKEGVCIAAKECTTIVSLLRKPYNDEDLQFVKNSRCESAVPQSVCCGPERTRESSPTILCEPSAAPPDPRTECCGLDSSTGNKIFGGSTTAIDQYPWLTLIDYEGVKDSEIVLLCGGVLISGKYVLTAGHCVLGPVLEIAKPINVRLGEYDIFNDGNDCVEVEGGGQDCTEGATIIPIEKIIPHHSYDPDSTLRRHDIALLRLQNTAPYSEFIRPICLPMSDVADNVPKPTLYAAGWGAVSSEQAYSDVKLHVDLPFVSEAKCQPSYNVPGRRVQLWSGQICAGGQKGKDSCRGDSGGPLMLANGGLYEVVGIVNFGPTPCGIENIPGVYTKVYEYMPWIRSQIKP